MAEIKLVSLKKSFGDVTAVNEIDIDVKDKEFFVLLGPTGAGKTTTLRLIAGLEKPDQGDIYFDHEKVNDLGPAIRDVAFVFQYYTLYPHYTVRQNLEFPLKSNLRKTPQDVINKKIEEVAKILHVEHLFDRQTVNLSGGEMQRIAIGRAIVRTPKVFLMDEPLSNLDAKLREEMRAELARLHLDLGETFFYVTHDQIEAMTMGDRIGVLNEGNLLQTGTPDEIYNKPINTFVARFVGSPMINLLDAEIEGQKLIIGKRDRAMECTLNDYQCKLVGNAKSKSVILGIRPEDIIVSKEKQGNNSFECTIYFKQSMGVEDILNLKVTDELIFKAVAPTKFMANVGDRIFANFKMDRSHIFDYESGKRLEL
ncbi:MAG: ABC transporter ATP-binding protein [Actinobacteria bacterium]|nr:ABC transporter ATP-binding protein [Cyanobacteriota bacterium]MCL5772653.1 ABC transporter ATP-binding protein [Actinomycetota bacterium]